MKGRTKAHWAYTRRNPKRHIPPVSLLLCRKIVAVNYFVWALGLRLWSVRQAGRQAVRQWGSELDEILSFGNFFKSLYPVTTKWFRDSKVLLILDGLTLLRKGDFCCEISLYDGFWRRHFRRRTQETGQSLLKQYDRTVWYSRVWHTGFLDNTTH